ncbi:uncharacterized protein BX663DRAFT_516941 [Cokeromyces recurvatus]|uniref:uncharacterized protein n=1 Tax=Cokeromyces recurvatus TaxID=90255 RepID=UPI00221E6BFC|nr:uncharacterized protein BX663DRAFT_516941 [Cokeromyces recurvatus]KAI7900589.1 hypothetical protein BX663DRAFT_516941 [Cokeromyces recurvatus]
MKSVRFALINKKFDDQYTFELQGYMSVYDFCSTFNLLNQTVRQTPPPGNTLFWCIALWILWTIEVIGHYLIWIYTKCTYSLYLLPFFIMTSTLLTAWIYRIRRQKFESTIITLCNRINATENMRGINYRFSKNGSDLNDITKQVKIVSLLLRKPIYHMVVEFDDRYDDTFSTSTKFNDFVTVPLYAHVAPNTKKESFYPSWSSSTDTALHYDEKFIIQYT